VKPAKSVVSNLKKGDRQNYSLPSEYSVANRGKWGKTGEDFFSFVSYNDNHA
jgi:hypothetical protein